MGNKMHFFKKEEPEGEIERRCRLMRLNHDCLVSLLLMLGMKECARLDSAMSEKKGKGRGLLLETMGSGDVCYEGSKDKEDCIRGDCLRWLGKRRLSLLSLSCERRMGNDQRGPIDVTSEMVVEVARNSRKLKALYLRGWRNGFPVDDMTQIATHCHDVETLAITHCYNVGDEEVLLAAASGMRKLKNVDFSDFTYFSDSSLSILSCHCQHIVKANFACCKGITDEGLVSFAKGCLLMEDLNLYDVNRITDVGIKAIANGYKFIKSLDVSCCDLITDESIKLLAQQCSLLEKIIMTHCNQLTDAALKHLANLCPALTDVNVSACQKLTDEGLIHLVKTRGSSIRSLCFGSLNRLLTDLSVLAIADNCTSITDFKIIECPNMTNNAVIYLMGKRGSNLCSLSIGFCRLVTDSSLMAIADNCPLLTSVSIWGTSKMTDEAVIHLVRTRGSNIRTLNVGYFGLLTDLSVMAIADNCPHLVKLFLLCNDNITDVSVARLVQRCRELCEIDLSRCKKITDVSLEKIGESCPSPGSSLQTIWLHECPLITREGKNALKQRVPHLAVRTHGH